MEVTSRTAVVFGGAGFIGTHLVRALAAAGTSVVVADIKEPQHALPEGARFEFCDVSELITIERDRPFDAVYNLAAVHRTPGHEPHEYYVANVRGALNLVEWMEAGGEQSLTFTSSIAVYGPSEEIKSESSTPMPTSDYGRSKLMAEDIFRRWRRSDESRKLVIARPAVVFGPGEGGNFTRLAKALRRRTFVYPGRNDVIKSGGYVADLVKALMWATYLPDAYVLFNYCYPQRSTIADICSAFNEVAGYRLPPMLPSAYVGTAMKTLKTVNPSDKGSLSAARVAKLTASTNIAADELVRRGFEWDTDVRSALSAWQTASEGRFI